MALSLEAWHVDNTAAEITLAVTATPAHVPCPLCHIQSPRVHSRHTRTLADLPWGAYAVRLQLRVRKVFCDNPGPATLLRLVRAAPPPRASAPQVIGVDEWAWRRGQRYGTILVDLKEHRGLDLLPERSAAAVAAWLAQHPTITVVCRDQSSLYADGIRRGAPHAVQVVDRFHLVKNLREAVEAFLHNQRAALQAAATRTAQALTLSPPCQDVVQA